MVSNFELTPEVEEGLNLVVQYHSCYISSYIEILNKIIGYQRKISTLRFERATLIKYVKKLRFLNDFYHNWETYKSELNNQSLFDRIRSLGSFAIRYLELLDILNYYVTQSLKNETISKTLNYDLILTDDTIANMDDTYRMFVKFTQWMVESLELNQSDLTLEIVQFTRKCAFEDGVDLEDTNDILLQEVALVADSQEYGSLLTDWSIILDENLRKLQTSFDIEVDRWSNLFDQKRK